MGHSPWGLKELNKTEQSVHTQVESSLITPGGADLSEVCIHMAFCILVPMAHTLVPETSAYLFIFLCGVWLS